MPGASLAITSRAGPTAAGSAVRYMVRTYMGSSQLSAMRTTKPPSVTAEYGQGGPANRGGRSGNRPGDGAGRREPVPTRPKPKVAYLSGDPDAIIDRVAGSTYR